MLTTVNGHESWPTQNPLNRMLPLPIWMDLDSNLGPKLILGWAQEALWLFRVEPSLCSSDPSPRAHEGPTFGLKRWNPYQAHIWANVGPAQIIIKIGLQNGSAIEAQAQSIGEKYTDWYITLVRHKVFKGDVSSPSLDFHVLNSIFWRVIERERWPLDANIKMATAHFLQWLERLSQQLQRWNALNFIYKIIISKKCVSLMSILSYLIFP